MLKISPFENYSTEYDEWFVRNHFAYQSELVALKKIIPLDKKGLEVGSGSGLFAKPLGIKFGIDPSREMNRLAKARGIHATTGVAEDLPFKDATFDFVLLVTSICFVNDTSKTFSEAYRVLKKDGVIILGFVDKDSPIGQKYQQDKEKSLFYKEATFYSTQDLTKKLKLSSFSDFIYYQTLFRPSGELTKIDNIKKGYGQGSFIALKAKRI